MLGAIAFGVAALIITGGFVQDVYTQLAEALIHSQSGHLQIARASFFAEGSRSPEKNLLAKPKDLATVISRAAPGSTTMTRLSFSGLVNNGRTDFPIVGEGVEPGKEAELMSQARIVAGRSLDAKDQTTMVIGQGLANALQLHPGDRANLLASSIDGAINTLDFQIVGVSQSFSKEYDLRAVRVPLTAAQELLGTDGANVIVLMLKDTRDTSKVAAKLKTVLRPIGDLAVMTWKDLNPFYRSTVELYDRLFLVLRLIVVILVMLAVANAINMTVFERASEFGTMRALGDRSLRVVALVLTESLILGVAGSAVGVTLGMLLAWLISLVGLPMPPPPGSDLGYTAHIRIVGQVVLDAFAGGVLGAMLAGILPAMRIARTPIIDALAKAP